MKKNIRTILVLAFICLLSSCDSCSNSGTTITGNPQIPITIGRLTSDGKSTITMPLSIFGDSSEDLTGVTIDVYNNDVLKLAAIDPATYYDTSAEAVRFVLTSLAAGDELRFDLISNSTAVSYIGTVSADADTEATNTLFGYSLTDNTPNITFVSNADGSNRIAIAADAFGGSENLTGATVTMTFTYYDGTTVTESLSAEDYYSSMAQSVFFSVSELYNIEFYQDMLDYDFDTEEEIYSDDSLMTIDFVISLADGSQRTYRVGVDDFNTDSDEDIQVSWLGFTGTGNESFTSSYNRTLNNLAVTGDCADEITDEELAEENGYRIRVDATIDQGFVSLVFSDSLDPLYGIINSDSSFLAHATQLWNDAVFTAEASGSIDSSSINMNFLWSYLLEGGETCVITFALE